MLLYLFLVLIALVIAGSVYARWKLPWPFRYNGQKYKRYRDGSFTDATGNKVTDAALIPILHAEYEKAKYKSGEANDWSIDSD
jgi:hypothetical protein